MQFQFEFDAPKYCSLNNLPHQRIPSDYSLHDDDQTDFWFMHTHQKPHLQINSCPTLSNEPPPGPVLRTHLQILEEPLISSNQPENEETQQNTSTNNHFTLKSAINPQRLLDNNGFGKKKKITVRKTAIEKPKPNPIIKHYSAEKQEKQLNLSKPALRSKSLLQKTNLKDIRPCPFAPRIERQWELKYQKKWYSLSPAQKVEAQRLMKQIQNQKQNKSNVNILKQEPGKKQQHRTNK